MPPQSLLVAAHSQPGACRGFSSGSCLPRLGSLQPQRTRKRFRRKFRVCCCPFTPPQAAHKPLRADLQGTEAFLGCDCHPAWLFPLGPKSISWGQLGTALEGLWIHPKMRGNLWMGLDWDLCGDPGIGAEFLQPPGAVRDVQIPVPHSDPSATSQSQVQIPVPSSDPNATFRSQCQVHIPVPHPSATSGSQCHTSVPCSDPSSMFRSQWHIQVPVPGPDQDRSCGGRRGCTPNPTPLGWEMRKTHQD